MSAFEENEISRNAQGGTEIAKRRLEQLIDPELLQHFQIVCSRVRELDPKKIRIYWVHDLPHDPECSWMSDPAARDRFHKIVFISNWQEQIFQTFHKMPWTTHSAVLETGIDPADDIDLILAQKPKDCINLYYASTPQRGLELLIPVFRDLHERLPDYSMKLHVHSSFKIYGWDKADENFEPLYKECRDHPAIEYHGFTPHDELLERIKKYHIFAYPCVWPETSCRTMLEAMSAGCISVHSNIAALPETSGGLNFMYHGDVDGHKHVNEFLRSLYAAVVMMKKNLDDSNDWDTLSNRLRFNKAYVDTRFNIHRIKSEWERILGNLLSEYPDEASRAIPAQQEMFSLKV